MLHPNEDVDEQPLARGMMMSRFSGLLAPEGEGTPGSMKWGVPSTNSPVRLARLWGSLSTRRAELQPSRRGRPMGVLHRRPARPL